MSLPTSSVPFFYGAAGSSVLPTVRMWHEDGGNWSAVDVANISDVKLTVSYSHPRRLTFTYTAPQHTRPIAERELIVFTDTFYGGFGTPLFEGPVTEITPGERPDEVQYTCHDSTWRAQEWFVVNAPVAWSTAIPRVVYNVPLPQDEDRAFEEDHDASVGQIITDMLSNLYATLTSNYAAPPVQIGGPAYVAGDLSAMDFVPQDKIVLEAESLKSAIDRMLDYYPDRRMVFIPGHFGRKWRFVQPTESNEITLTLSDPDASKNIIKVALKRSIESRWTAVKIFGPPRTTAAVVETDDSSLLSQWSIIEQVQLETTGPDSPPNAAARVWQIADPNKRHMAKLMPTEVAVPAIGMSTTDSRRSINLSFVLTRYPTLAASWDGGETYEPATTFRYDPLTGIITTPWPVVRRTSTGWVLPDSVRLYFAHFDEPFSARFPASGYSGTAYDDAGIETELQQYDEALAIGYEFGTPVTSAARIAEYEKLAEAIQRAHRDIVYSGGCTIEGLDYDFLHLQHRVNFDGVDAAGDPVTDFDNAKAVVTEVEYDYTERITTLVFSSDRLEFDNVDVDALKAFLKIRDYETYVTQHSEIVRTPAGYTILNATRFHHLPQPTAQELREATG